MLALAIALLFALTGIVALLFLADSVLKARHAYVRLMREASLTRTGFVVQVDPRELRMRRTSVRVTRLSRAQVWRSLPACAAA